MTIGLSGLSLTKSRTARRLRPDLALFLQELACGEYRIVHHFIGRRGLVGADVSRDGGGLAIARGPGVTEEGEYFAELRIVRKLFFHAWQSAMTSS